MADPLYEYLRFYRDLGFTDLYVPQGARGFAGFPGAVNEPAEDASPAAAADGVPGLKPTAPAPSWGPVAAGAVATGRPVSAAPVRPVRRDAPTPSPPGPPKPLPSGAASAPKDPLAVLHAIQAEIGECTRCRLHQGRSKIVFGSGNPAASLVFVGEGPGADEDAQGLPFVGRAGQLLTQMINNTASGEGIPISRDDVYICNVVKCRPPGNRTPEPDEMETCGQFLTRQLDAIRPKAICLLGATAARYLLGTKLGITKLRGNWQDWRGIPVMPTYHPSFLLRPYAQDKKREAWEDLKKVLHYVYDSE
jgi:DNA polymerase